MGIHVASVPAGHVYVRHLSPAGGGDGVERLPDPRPGTSTVMAASYSLPQ